MRGQASYIVFDILIRNVFDSNRAPKIENQLSFLGSVYRYCRSKWFLDEGSKRSNVQSAC